MSTNQTANYNLSQWVKSDQVKMEDFNADNAKIDAALGSLAASVAGKASASTVSSLQSTVSSHSSSLAKKGNCQLYTTTYTGTGLAGASNPVTLTFPKKPMMVIVTNGNNRLVLLRGADIAWTEESSYRIPAANITWGDRSVSWYTENARLQMSGYNLNYAVFALLQAD